MEFCAELAQQFGTLRRTLIVGGVNGIATGMLRCRDAASALAMRLTDVLCSTRPVKGLPSSVTFRPVDHTALAAAVERLGAHETMVIRPEQSERLQSEFGITAKELLVALLRLVRHHAIPPISNFKVGAAGLGASGAIYFGVNLEFPNDRIGHTVHAEQFMISNAFSNGETGIVALAVNAAPCGHCRQFINELPAPDAIEVLIADIGHAGDDSANAARAGAPIKVTVRPFPELLPDSFGPADLGVVHAFMAHPANGVVLASGAAAAAGLDFDDAVLAAAVAAADASYAPHSGCPAGVAVSVGGKVFGGSYIENAAFNPSLPAMQSALIAARGGGVRDWGMIDRVVVAERDCGAGFRHEASTREMAKLLAPGAQFAAVRIDIHTAGGASR